MYKYLGGFWVGGLHGGCSYGLFVCGGWFDLCLVDCLSMFVSVFVCSVAGSF